MKILNTFTITTLLFTLLFQACGGNEQPENPEVPEEEEVQISVQETMVGKWVSTETRRSGNAVDFPDFHLEYTSDSVFTSDLIDASQNRPFENGEKIILTGRYISFPNVESYFNVDMINDTVLVLSTELRDYPFEFEFKREEE